MKAKEELLSYLQTEYQDLAELAASISEGENQGVDISIGGRGKVTEEATDY